MEPRAVLRISVGDRSKSAIVHHWFDRDGSRLVSDLIEQLGLDQLVVAERRLRENDQPNVSEWIDAVTGGLDSSTLVGATIAWCRWVSGKVRVQFDNGRYDFVEFQGWAAQWAAGQIESPKFRCLHSNLESYNIVCLNDGTVTVQEAVDKCEQSGEEAFRDAMQKCCVSGKRVLKSLLTTCPISMERFLPDLAEKCSCCQRDVSPGTICSGICQHCRELAPIDASHPVVSRLQESHGGYRKIRRWKGWVSDDLAVLVGSRLLSEDLIVLNVGDGEIRRTAHRSKLTTTWKFDR
ncbi:MAG: hypothetical protein R3C05_05440 [Pirellulaceae bacterium]